LEHEKKIERILNESFDNKTLMGLVYLKAILDWKIRKEDAIEKKEKILRQMEIVK
jgi:hypothetical protein